MPIGKSPFNSAWSYRQRTSGVRRGLDYLNQPIIEKFFFGDNSIPIEFGFSVFLRVSAPLGQIVTEVANDFVPIGIRENRITSSFPISRNVKINPAWGIKQKTGIRRDLSFLNQSAVNEFYFRSLSSTAAFPSEFNATASLKAFTPLQVVTESSNDFTLRDFHNSQLVDFLNRRRMLDTNPAWGFRQKNTIQHGIDYINQPAVEDFYFRKTFAGIGFPQTIESRVNVSSTNPVEVVSTPLETDFNVSGIHFIDTLARVSSGARIGIPPAWGYKQKSSIRRGISFIEQNPVELFYLGDNSGKVYTDIGFAFSAYVRLATPLTSQPIVFDNLIEFSTLFRGINIYTPFFAGVTSPPGRAAGSQTTAGLGFPSLQNNYLKTPGFFKDDLLIVFAETRGDEAPTMVGTGWTEAEGSPIINLGTDSTRQTIFWKRAEVNEPAPSITQPGNHVIADLLVVRGAVKTGNPFDVITTNQGDTSNVTIPGGQTTLQNMMYVASITTTSNLFGQGSFVPANVVLDGIDNKSEVDDQSWDGGGLSVDGNGGSVSIYIGTIDTPRIYGGFTGTNTQGDRKWAGWSATIKPMPKPEPALVSVTSPAISTTGISVGLTNIIDKDLIILMTETANEPIAITSSTGWQDVPDTPKSTTLTNPTLLTMKWKRVSGTEPTIVVSDPGEHVVATALVFRGASQNVDPFNTWNSIAYEGTVTNSFSVPGSTTTADNCFILTTIASTNFPTFSGNLFLASGVNASLENFRETVDYGFDISNSGIGGSLGAHTGIKRSAGTYSSSTGTFQNITGGGVTQYVAHSLAIMSDEVFIESILTGQVKIWNGSDWVLKPFKIWSGSDWSTKPIKIWTGTDWQEID